MIRLATVSSIGAPEDDPLPEKSAVDVERPAHRGVSATTVGTRYSLRRSISHFQPRQRSAAPSSLVIGIR